MPVPTEQNPVVLDMEHPEGPSVLVLYRRPVQWSAVTAVVPDFWTLRASTRTCIGEALYRYPLLPRPNSFQARVLAWGGATFGSESVRDPVERNHRFLEESLELVQSLGCTASEAHQLVEYVYGRPVGDPVQEFGGVAVTLALLGFAAGCNVDSCGEVELRRIWGKVSAIRAKQAAKPKHGPLPGPTAPALDPTARERINHIRVALGDGPLWEDEPPGTPDYVEHPSGVSRVSSTPVELLDVDLVEPDGLEDVLSHRDRAAADVEKAERQLAHERHELAVYETEIERLDPSGFHRVRRGLEEARAHVRGEAVSARAHVVQVPTSRFGALIRKLRRSHAFTLGDVAEGCDVLPSYVSDLERARVPPPVGELLETLAACLKSTPEALRAAIAEDDAAGLLARELSGEEPLISVARGPSGPGPTLTIGEAEVTPYERITSSSDTPPIGFGYTESLVPGIEALPSTTPNERMVQAGLVARAHGVRLFYVASRASIPERGAMWRAARDTGVPIVASWIDEDGPGQTPDMGVLWERIDAEIRFATDLVLYVERGDLPLKGALVEVGMALAGGLRVAVFANGFAHEDAVRLLGSWCHHPNVLFYHSLDAAFGR